MNRTAAPVRVIQIWFVAETRYMGLAPHYEQVPLAKMRARQAGDGLVREIIGPAGNTDAHVDARLTATTVPAGGSTPIQAPRPGEDLFLYVVDGTGRWQNGAAAPLNLYDVMLATPEMPAATIHASDEPLTFLSFYLQPFLNHS